MKQAQLYALTSFSLLSAFIVLLASSHCRVMTVFFLTLLCFHVLICLSSSVSEQHISLRTTNEPEPTSRCVFCAGSGFQTNTTAGRTLNGHSHIHYKSISSARRPHSKVSVVTMIVTQVRNDLLVPNLSLLNSLYLLPFKKLNYVSYQAYAAQSEACDGIIKAAVVVTIAGIRQADIIDFT